MTKNHYLLISELPEDALAGEDPREVKPLRSWWVVPHSNFEYKIGWSTPLLKPRDDELVVLVHGVDKELETYRAFAMHVAFSSSEGIVVRAVTPSYIMEPRFIYEVLGDRPYTVFPCGAWLVDKNTILLSYGAADQMVGFGLLNVDELMSELDRGRIY